MKAYWNINGRLWAGRRAEDFHQIHDYVEKTGIPDRTRHGMPGVEVSGSPTIRQQLSFCYQDYGYQPHLLFDMQNRHIISIRESLLCTFVEGRI